MPTLHTVNRSPFERDTLRSCLVHAGDGDGVLLIENGIYAALRTGATEPLLNEALARLRLWVLGPDLQARGIGPERLIAGIGVVDYGGFVDLTIEHDKVLSWL